MELRVLNQATNDYQVMQVTNGDEVFVFALIKATTNTTKVNDLMVSIIVQLK